MKRILLITFLIVLFIVKSFGQSCLIYGTTAPHFSYKYVYLYDQETKAFLSTPIINHQFSIKMDKPNKLKILMLSFNDNLLKNYKELVESPDYGYPNRARIIALEDTVEILLEDRTQNAVVNGKSLNKDIDDMFAAIKTRKYADFFKQHSSSLVSLVFLKTLVDNVINGSPFFNRNECREWYGTLSDTIKNSEEGKEIFRSIPK